MTTDEFKRWMRRMGFTISKAAKALDISERLVAYYRSGHRVPRVVALACAQLTHLKGKDSTK